MRLRGRPSRWRTPSAAWPCAARRPSAWPRPTGWRWGCAAARDPERLAAASTRSRSLLGSTRPTAVNLRWALERGRKVFAASAPGPRGGRRRRSSPGRRSCTPRTCAINRRIGEHGAALFAPGARVLTHCNTGALATAGYGTALGVIQSAAGQGRAGQVWVDETRPLLQGARLTAWELKRLGIPFRADHRQQRRRADVAGAGGPHRGGRRPHRRQRRYGQQDRHLHGGRAGAPAQGSPSTSPRRSRRSTSRRPTARPSPSRSARPAEVTEVFGTRVAPADTRPSTSPSTSPRPS